MYVRKDDVWVEVMTIKLYYKDLQTILRSSKRHTVRRLLVDSSGS